VAIGPEVAVKFVADTTGFEQGAAQVSGGFDRMKGAAGALASGLAGLQVGQFIGDAVKSASDLNEAAGKVDAVFGDSASTIQAWSKTTATSMGVSQKSALDAAGSFGNMLTQVGLTDDQAAGMSTTMVGLASDFAAFNNVDPTSVLEAQQAAFRGEYDALQKFVPTINAAAVEQRALADTGKASADQLTAQEKAMATYKIMTEQAGAAQGNFADTSDELAQKQKIANAQWEDAQAALGQQLLPIMSTFAGLLTDLLPTIEKFAPVIMPLVIAFGAWAAITSVLTTVTTAFGVSLGIAVGWIALIVIAIVGIGVALVWAYNNVEWFRNAVQAVFGWIADHWQLLLAIIAGPIGGAVALIITHWDTLKSAAQAVWNFLVGVFNGIVSAVSAMASGVIGFFSAVASFIAGVFTSAVSGAVSAVIAVWDTLKSAASSAVQWIKDRFGDVASFFTGIPGKISSALSGVYEAIIGPFKRALDWLGDIPGKVKSIIDSIPGAGAISGILGGLNPFSAPAPAPIPTAPTGAFARTSTGLAAAAFMPSSAGLFSGGGASRLGRATGLGTHVTYELTINVPPTFNPSEVGRNVVDAIRAFESSAGSGWRR